MIRVVQSTVIDAPVAEVWAILRDFNGHSGWHPAIAASVIEDGLPGSLVGAVRDFRLADGSRIREQLLSLSDRDHTQEYCILEAPLPLMGYVARIALQAVTDGERTFWQWSSRFSPPRSRERELTRLVTEDIYQAGFRAIKQALRGAPRRSAPQAPAQRSGPETPAHAIVMQAHGGPQVLRHQPITVPRPGPGEARIRQRFIGVNFIDVYCRTGYFNLVTPPGIPGMEAAGVIESVGAGVTAFQPGDRVAYACAPPGAYTDLRVMPADQLAAIPDFLSEELAAAALLKGITAGFLLHDVYSVKPGDQLLVHAAAGGVGLLLCQWAKALGARVTGAVSSEEKAVRARLAGCDHVIIHTREDFASAVLERTGGRGVDAVYDAVGKESFEGSLRALKTRGTLVSFGQASGDIGAYEVGRLAGKSLTLTRPSYGHFTDTPDAMQHQSQRFFAALRAGLVRVDPPLVFPLAEAARAHAALESRKVTGSIVLAA